MTDRRRNLPNTIPSCATSTGPGLLWCYGPCFPGQDGGPNRCGYAHGEPGPDQPEGVLRGDQPGPGAAELVTDDAWKLSDQLERATGERVAALDGAAMEAAHETVFGLGPGGVVLRLGR